MHTCSCIIITLFISYPCLFIPLANLLFHSKSCFWHNVYISESSSHIPSCIWLFLFLSFLKSTFWVVFWCVLICHCSFFLMFFFSFLVTCVRRFRSATIYFTLTVSTQCFLTMEWGLVWLLALSVSVFCRSHGVNALPNYFLHVMGRLLLGGFF